MPEETTEPQPQTDLPPATAENQEPAMSDPAATPRSATEPPKLSRAELLAAQQQTLATPRRRYGIPARLLFTTMDLLYGRRRTLSKFKMLELIARVPYQSWEQVAYIAVTHVYRDPGFARRVYERIAESRVQQDNEQWHLLILEELVARSGRRESQLRYYWVPQPIAFGYYQLSQIGHDERVHKQESLAQATASRFR